MRKKLLFPTKLSKLNFFSRFEIAEIPNLLLPDEEVLGVLSGFYSAGTATLCVTNKRLLLVDKKWLRMSYEDIRYQAISEVSYSRQGFLASVHFFYTGRDLHFRSYYRNELKVLAQFVEGRMTVERNSGSYRQSQPISAMLDAVVPDPIEQIRRWRKTSHFLKSLGLVEKASV